MIVEMKSDERLSIEYYIKFKPDQAILSPSSTSDLHCLEIMFCYDTLNDNHNRLKVEWNGHVQFPKANKHVQNKNPFFSGGGIHFAHCFLHRRPIGESTGDNHQSRRFTIAAQLLH